LRARLPWADAGLALGGGRRSLQRAVRTASARVLTGPVRRSGRARGGAPRRRRGGLHRRARTGPRSAISARSLPNRGAGTVSPLRDALLRRRGADRLRQDGPHVRARPLGARARSPHGGEVSFGWLRARRRAADVDRRLRRRLRLAGAIGFARLD